MLYEPVRTKDGTVDQIESAKILFLLSNLTVSYII